MLKGFLQTSGATRVTSMLGDDASVLTEVNQNAMPKDDAKMFNKIYSACVNLQDASVSNGILSVTRSVRDIDIGKTRNYLYTIPIPRGHGFFPFSIPPSEMHHQIKARIPSPSGERLLILREETAESMENSPERTRLVFEIWTKAAECLTKRVVIPETLHGEVINQPDGFGAPSWSDDESAMVYCARQNRPEVVSYFDNLDNSKGGEQGSQRNLDYSAMGRLGDKCTKISALLNLYLLHIRTGAVTKIENTPNGEKGKVTDGGYVFGQASFSPCGSQVVYTAWDSGGGGEMPRQLGMVQSYNRPSKLYASPVKKLLLAMSQSSGSRSALIPSSKDAAFICLSDSCRLSRSPRFSKAKKGKAKLCFLASQAGFDTHNGSVSLYTIDWDVKSGKPILSTTRCLVKSCVDPIKRNEENTVHVANMCFPGLYVFELPKRCCSSDFIYATTQWGSVEKVVRISLDDGTVSLVNVDIIRSSGQSTESLASQQLLGVDLDGGAIIMESAPNRPAIVGYVTSSALRRPNVSRKVEGTLVAEMGPIAVSSYSETKEREVVKLLNYHYEVFLMNVPPPKIDDNGADTETPVQWIFMRPPNRSDSLPPLIVVPHGGPHSCTSTTYIPEFAFLCARGYAILHVNYRGSTGFGKRALESLPGNVGKLDVDDVVHAVETITSSGWVDVNRVGVYGESHGGFIAAHCVGQYPKIFKVAAMRNPVTNIATMTTATDIPDWCYIEALGCGQYDYRKFRGASADELKSMWDCSPIRYANKVTAPILIALGKKR